MTTPSLAMPAATIAICSGVAVTSNWPMPGQRGLRRVQSGG